MDTGHNFPEVLALPGRRWWPRADSGCDVAQVQDWIDDGRLSERPDGTRNPLQTVPLVDTIVAERFDAVIGGARRDEEKVAGQGTDLLAPGCVRRLGSASTAPRTVGPYNGKHAPGEHVRVFPISNWTELDVWNYIEAEQIVLPDIYYAHEREVFPRNGMWLAPGEWGGPVGPESSCERRQVRYRTVG